MLLGTDGHTRPGCPGLVVAPHQNPGENHEHRDYGGGNQNRIDGHWRPPVENAVDYAEVADMRFDADQTHDAQTWDRKITALRRSHRLSARCIHKFHASRRNFDHAVALEFGECAAHGLDGETEKICDIQAAHRQRYRAGRAPDRG